MKNFKAISKSKVTFDIPSKACALVLSIMLAVTGIMPSLAANNIGVKKNKSISSVKQEKSEVYNLSVSDNVKATLDNNKNLNITATSTSGDMHIDRKKWSNMIEALKGFGFNWEKADVKNINFKTSGIYLPNDSSKFFYNFKGAINGCEKINTSDVTNMERLFQNASLANPNVSNWDVSKVKTMDVMFFEAKHASPNVSNWDVSSLESARWMFDFSGVMKLDLSKWRLNPTFLSSSGYKNDMFVNCSQLEYLKTPAGLKTTMSGANHDFKIITLKKGEPASVEKESQNLYLKYIINFLEDDKIIYHLYRKDKYVGVTFDKNGGNGETWRNHGILEKGKSIKDSNGNMPAEIPTRKGYNFLGWSEDKNATTPDFDENTQVNNDVTVYALWKKKTPDPGNVTVEFDKNSGIGNMDIVEVEKGKTIRAQIEAAVANKIFIKEGYRFVGFSKSKFATKPDYNLDSPVYSDMMLYAVYEEAPALTTVNIKYSDINLGEDVKIEGLRVGKPIGAKLDGNARDRDGYRFLGYSKLQNSAKPDFFKKSTVRRDLVIYPVYKQLANNLKVKITFDANGGDKAPKAEIIGRYESLTDKMPKDKPLRDGHLFTGWARSKTAKYPDFFKSTVVAGNITVYAVWKSLYNEKLGQAVLNVSAKAKGYELLITPPAANQHTGFEIFRSEKKDFKPSKDNKIATVDRNILKYLDEKADNGKAYYYAVRAIDTDGSYNGTKVTFIGKLSDKVLAAPLPKDKGVTATVAGKGAVDLEFSKTIAAAKYKVVAEPSGTPSVPVTKEIAAKDVKQLANGKASINVDKLPLGKLLVFKLTALNDANEELVAYSNSTAFMLPVPGRQTARAKTIKIKKGKKKVKIRILDFKFSKVKWATGYEVKLSINGKKPKRIILKGKDGFMVIKGKRIVLPKRGKFKITFVAFRKIGNLRYNGTKITKSFK